MIERRYYEALGQIPPAPKIIKVAGGAGRPGRSFATAVAASGATVVTVFIPQSGTRPSVGGWLVCDLAPCLLLLGARRIKCTPRRLGSIFSRRRHGSDHDK